MRWDGNPVYFRGKASYQTPVDLLRMAQLVWECGPTWIIETGSGDGGTTELLRCASEHSEVLGVEGDSLGAFELVQAQVNGQATSVVLDSDVYSADHMLKELLTYGMLVTSGQILVVCHTDREDWGSLPALKAWPYRDQFETLEPVAGSLNTYLRRR